MAGRQKRADLWADEGPVERPANATGYLGVQGAGEEGGEVGGGEVVVEEQQGVGLALVKQVLDDYV